MALSPITKWFGCSDLEIAKLIADWPAGTAPAAPSAPSAPTLSGAGSSGGAATWTYTAVLTNGTDSTASTAATTAVGAATLTAAVPITVTVAAVPAGQVCIIQRTASGNPTGSPVGVIGKIGPGGTALTDSGQPGQTYTANTSGTAYGPSVRLVGGKSFTVNGTVDNKELRGDVQLLDMNAILHDLTFTSQFAKSNNEALAVMLGGTTTYTGSTPNQIAKYALNKTNAFSYFRVEAQAYSSDPVAGDAHVVLYRSMLNAFPQVGTADENYETFTFSARCAPRLSDGNWLDVVINETKTPTLF